LPTITVKKVHKRGVFGIFFVDFLIKRTGVQPLHLSSKGDREAWKEQNGGDKLRKKGGLCR